VRNRGRHGGQLSYGVLVGKIRDGKLSATHYEIWVSAGGRDFRIAVNVRSVDGSDVLVHYEPNYTQNTKADLAHLAAGSPGFTAIPTGPHGSGLDYIRDDLFPIADMHPIPEDGMGVTLHNLIDAQIERAKADATAIVIAFGDSFSDPGQSVDTTFGFSPEIGVHDIHFMQGSTGAFARDNRSNGDGALFIRYAGGETIALFLRFVTQSLATDESGAPVG